MPRQAWSTSAGKNYTDPSPSSPALSARVSFLFRATPGGVDRGLEDAGAGADLRGKGLSRKLRPGSSYLFIYHGHDAFNAFLTTCEWEK